MGCRDDNISLDRIVDWVESAGYQLRRIADYGEWFAGFRAALELLEPRLQAASSLPIIYQWEQPLSQTPDLKCAPPRRLCQRRPEVQGGPVCGSPAAALSGSLVVPAGLTRASCVRRLRS